MGHKNNLLLFTTSFIGGLATGLLLSPGKGSQNRTWLSKQAAALGHKAKIQQKIDRLKSKSELSKVQKTVHQGVRQYIPDLYEATNSIQLSKKDVAQ